MLAALELQRRVREAGMDGRTHQDDALELSIGLYTGQVAVGRIGDAPAGLAAVVGDSVMRALALQAQAAPGTILCSAATVHLVQEMVRVAAVAPVPMPGEPAPLAAYTVFGPHRRRHTFRTMERQAWAPFVGRQHELATLRALLAEALAGRGQVVGMIGEPGVGKSRLCYEFLCGYLAHPWVILETQGTAYGQATPYLPVIDLLKDYFRLEDRDDVLTVHDKVTAKLRGLDNTLMPTAPAFLALFDVPIEDPEWQALDARQRRQFTLEAVKRLLLWECREQPLLLVVENLHWIDAETQAVLDTLIQSLPAAHMFLLTTYRPEYQHGWGNKTSYTQLRLDPLPRESARALANALLGSDATLEPLKHLLIERTAGNPFFLEESIRELLETKVLVGARGAYRLATALSSLQVPATVQATLAARIDRLPPPEKQLLQCAAVIGKEVSLALLQAIAEMPEGDLHRGLVHLQTAEFLYETSLFPEVTYTFKHALTQEVAYGSLLSSRRQALHEAIGIAVEELFPERLEEHCELLAHHFAQSRNPEKAVRYLTLAGKKAAWLFGYEPALAYFQEALKRIEGLPDREARERKEVEILFDLETIYDNLAKRDEQRCILERLVRSAMALNEPLILADAYIRQGEFLGVVGAAQDALAYSERALLTLKQLTGDRRREVKALRAMGFIYWQLGRYDEALRVHQEAFQTHRELGDLEGEGLDLINLGELFRQLHRYQEAIRCLEQAVQIGTVVGQPIRLVGSYYNLGNVYKDLGEYETALQHYQKAHEIGLWIGYGKKTASIRAALASMATICGQLGNHRDVIRYHQESLGSSRKIGDLPEVVATLRRLAVSHEILGEFPEALASYQEALTLSRDLEDRQNEWKILASLGHLYRQQLRDFPAALSCYRQSLTVTAATGEDEGHLGLLKGLGAAYWNLGLYEEAASAFAQALQSVEATEDRAEQAVVRSSLGVVLLSLRRYATALAHLQEALAIAKAMGDPRAEGYILNALGSVYHEVGDHGMAKECYHQAIQLRRTMQDAKGEGWSLHYLGRVHTDLDELDVARAYQEQALGLAEEIGDAELQARTKIALSATHRRRDGRAAVEVALRYAQEAVELSQAKGLGQEKIAALAHQGIAFLLLEDADRALGCSDEAVRLLEEAEGPIGEPELIWLYHARILRACGRKELADRYSKMAYEWAMERLAAVRKARSQESLVHTGLLREILAERALGGPHDAALPD